MKNRNIGLVLGAAAIALVFGTGQMFAKTARTAVATSTTAQYQAPAKPSAKMEKSQSFTGTVEKGPTGAFELNAGGMMYKLSNQAQAKQYAGKQVTVTGTLNSSSNTIQVQQIKVSSTK